MSGHQKSENDRRRSLPVTQPEHRRGANLDNVSAGSRGYDAAAGGYESVESFSEWRTTAKPLLRLPDARGEDRSDVANEWTDAQPVTKVDGSGNEQTHTDDVICLRQRGTRALRQLPHPSSSGDWTIGAASPCWLQLADPRGTLSRKHARLVHDGTAWIVTDLHSKNGLHVDGARRAEAVLKPGVELGLGSISLIAESARMIGAREYLERILGYEGDRMAEIDDVLRCLRVALTRSTEVVLCGDDDLVQISRGLHCRTLGANRPFIVCDPRRRTRTEDVRSAENCNVGVAAVEAATGGSLCVWASRLPCDFREVQRALRRQTARVQLFVCAREQSEAGNFFSVLLAIPPLTTRIGDLGRIINEYVAEAAATLGMLPGSFESSDREWVLAHASHSLAEIEKATLRLLAIRATGNLNRAAALLGMARVSLKKWIRRRPLPIPVDD
jgi:hypothetical protein